MFGELSERLKVQSWKGCVVKATKSSNLLLSAIFKQKCSIEHFFFGQTERIGKRKIVYISNTNVYICTILCINLLQYVCND